MKNAKKVLVTTATSEIFIIRRKRARQIIREFCPHCQKPTEMLDFNSAITDYGLGARELMRQIEISVVHSAETESGHLFICSTSLEISSRK